MGSDQARGKAAMDAFLLVGIIVVFLRCQLVGCTPIPAIPPGCHDLCMKLGGTYLDCIKECPPLEKCEGAMAMANLTEVYMGDGPIKRPQLCTSHCWESNEYTERRCMLDCPLTWCRKYGKVLPVTTSTAAPPKTTSTQMTTTMTSASPPPPATTTTTTKTPTSGNALVKRSDTKAPAVQDKSTMADDGTGPRGHSLVAIVLGTLSSVSLLAFLIWLAARYGHKRYLVRKTRQPTKHDDIPMVAFPATNKNDEEEKTYLRS